MGLLSINRYDMKRCSDYIQSDTMTPELQEAFDKPYPIKMKKQGKDYVGYVDLPDDTQLRVAADWEYDDPDTYQFLFSRDGSYDASNDGDAMRVFATVLSGLEQFIRKAKPEQFLFHAYKGDEDDRDLGSGSRESLYTRLIQRFARKMKYDSERFSDFGGSSYYLTRK